MCNKNFNPNVKNLKKLHYHYHFNGRYQKAEYSICNLRCSVPCEFQFVFDMGSNYNFHKVMKHFAKINE